MSGGGAERSAPAILARSMRREVEKLAARFRPAGLVTGIPAAPGASRAPDGSTRLVERHPATSRVTRRVDPAILRAMTAERCVRARIDRHAGRLGVGVIAGLLLILPLLLAEAYARRSPQLLDRLLDLPLWAESKPLAFARGQCPDAVSLGSSLTYRGLLHRFVSRAKVSPPIRTSFNFGVAQARAPTLLGMWRAVRDHHCTPRYLFLEVSPIVVNRRMGSNERDLPSVLDTRGWLSMPYSVFSDIELHRLAELTSWDRLLLSRRRQQARELVADWIAGRAAGARAHSATFRVGEFDSPRTVRLTGKRLRDARRRRTQMLRRGEIQWDFDLGYARLLRTIHREATEAGSRVILHTPPASSVFRDLLAATPEARAAWCSLYRGWSRQEGVEWFNQLDSREPLKDSFFYDWVHPNLAGAREYGRRLREAMQEGRVAAPVPCG